MVQWKFCLWTVSTTSFLCWGSFASWFVINLGDSVVPLFLAHFERISWAKCKSVLYSVQLRFCFKLFLNLFFVNYDTRKALFHTTFLKENKFWLLFFDTTFLRYHLQFQIFNNELDFVYHYSRSTRPNSQVSVVWTKFWRFGQKIHQ